MAFDKKTVQHLAHLARIEFKDEELEKLSRQLQEIISFIDNLKTADTQDGSAASRVVVSQNLFRDDLNKGSLAVNETLSNAPKKDVNFFVVPKVIE